MASLRTGAPDVIVDVVFDRGILFLTIANIGSRPAYRVSVEFDRRLMGLGGTKDLSGLALFRNLEFLAPHKEIRTLLDTSSSYFGRGEPTELMARTSFHDARGTRYVTTIKHNLAIYKDIGYLVKEDEGRPFG